MRGAAGGGPSGDKEESQKVAGVMIVSSRWSTSTARSGTSANDKDTPTSGSQIGPSA